MAAYGFAIPGNKIFYLSLRIDNPQIYSNEPNTLKREMVLIRVRNACYVLECRKDTYGYDFTLKSGVSYSQELLNVSRAIAYATIPDVVIPEEISIKLLTRAMEDYGISSLYNEIFALEKTIELY